MGISLDPDALSSSLHVSYTRLAPSQKPHIDESGGQVCMHIATK
jgi:hypothetical protein